MLNAPPGFKIEGCPVGNGGSECSRGCGGRYKISTAALTQAYLAGSLNPEKLCGPLADRINEASRNLTLFRREQEAQALLGINQTNLTP